MKIRLVPILSWLIALLTPLALIGLGARILMTPLFPNIEYRLPWFPKDDYGFTTEDRLKWGQKGIDYLVNDADISFLGDLKFDNGTPLFTERELGHMQDVKNVTQRLLRVWRFDLLILLLLGVWAWRGDWLAAFRQGLRRGGWLTLILAFTAGIIATLGASGSGDVFWQFFSGFHLLFFTGNSWLFLYSDTLIRLYPLQFWQDAILYIGLIAALGALGLVLGLRPRGVNA
ncbi:MAG: TIGR01906 family membrane protein [Chloroflexi bacterium]|nr:TIGR01906 family membrane protein [Chloroflexota bacterium]